MDLVNSDEYLEYIYTEIVHRDLCVFSEKKGEKEARKTERTDKGIPIENSVMRVVVLSDSSELQL